MKRILKIVWLPILLFIIYSCTVLQPMLNRRVDGPKVASLKENYQKLADRAKEWQSDAYLDQIYIPVNDFDGYIISADYKSDGTNKGLILSLFSDGSFTGEEIKNEVIVPTHKPINFEDFKIDSQQALNSMLDTDGLKLLENQDSNCSFLTLKRVLYEPGDPLVWTLALTDCSNSVKYIDLDPNSGKKLKINH